MHAHAVYVRCTFVISEDESRDAATRKARSDDAMIDVVVRAVVYIPTRPTGPAPLGLATRQ